MALAGTCICLVGSSAAQKKIIMKNIINNKGQVLDNLHSNDKKVTHMAIEDSKVTYTSTGPSILPSLLQALLRADPPPPSAAEVALVSTRWIVECVQKKKRVSEDNFKVTVTEVAAAATGEDREGEAEPALKKARSAASADPTLASRDGWQTVDICGSVVSSIGLGCLALSVGYPSLPPPNPYAILAAAVAAARPHAPLVMDTADTYCHPHTDLHANERMLSKYRFPAAAAAAAAAVPSSAATSAAASQRSASSSSSNNIPVRVSTKAGMQRVNSESTGWRAGSTSALAVRQSIVAAREAFNENNETRVQGMSTASTSCLEPLWLFSFHHADMFSAPGILEAALHEVKLCKDEGMLLHFGLCNASLDLLERARRCNIVQIDAVQNEWSVFHRETEQVKPASAAASSKKGVLAWCARHDVPFVASAPFGGLKTRRSERASLDYICPKLQNIAQNLGVSMHAALLAAMLHRGRQLGVKLLVLVGARTAAHAVDSISAAGIQFSDAHAEAIFGRLG